MYLDPANPAALVEMAFVDGSKNKELAGLTKKSSGTRS